MANKTRTVKTRRFNQHNRQQLSSIAEKKPFSLAFIFRIHDNLFSFRNVREENRVQHLSAKFRRRWFAPLYPQTAGAFRPMTGPVQTQFIRTRS
jgi:hypothetical protein